MIDQNANLKISRYKCPQCIQGRMIPVTEEGEADYTEHYACNQCDHQDSIPTLVIIISQMLSALIGISICLYLAFEHTALLTGLSAKEDTLVIKESVLILMACLFIASFVYVMYQAFSGAIHRYNYVNGNISDSE